MSPALKLSFCFIITLLISLSIPTFSFAADTPTQATPPQNTGQASSTPNCTGGGILNAQCFNFWINGQIGVEAIAHELFCGVGGISPFNACAVAEFDGIGKSTFRTYHQVPGGGAIGGIGSNMAMIYNNPPTSSGYYIAHIGEDLGITPKSAYAQVGGSGAGIIQPIFGIWQVIRNFAYMAFILVFIVVGLMIMFRQKLNPQTVISVQSALPGLVIGLILVTFSYFIAALVIDLAFLGIQIVAQIFIQAGGNSFGGSREIQELARNANLFQMFGATAFNGQNINTIYQAAGDISNTGVGNAGTWGLAGAGGVIGGLLFNVPGALIGFTLGSSAPIIVPTFLLLILIIALFIQLIRLLISLIFTYIQILMFALGGPLLILIGSIPGRSGNIGFWYKGLLANALIFPAVFAVFLFAGLIFGSGSNLNTSLPLFGQLPGSLMRVLIAYGIILGSPAIPGMVRKAFKVDFPPQIAQTAITGFTAGISPFRTAAQPLHRAHEHYAKQQAQAAVDALHGPWANRIAQAAIRWFPG